MKIAIDITSARRINRSGVGNCTVNLLEGLAKIDNENKYLLCFPLSLSKRFGTFQIDAKNFTSYCFASPLLWFEDNLFSKVDIFHGPDFRLRNYFDKSKKIITIHDLISFMDNDFMSDEFRELTQNKIKEAIRKTDCIITVSEESKKQLLHFFDFPENKISVIYWGIDRNLYYPYTKEVIKKVLKKHSIEEEYILFVGNIEERKNITGLLEAYAKLKSQNVKLPQLVLVGQGGWKYENIMQTYEKLNLIDSVKWTGYVPFEDLPILYAGALFLAYPSHYEGFGLPVLESFACGTPVLTTNAGALAEISGEAAYLIKPNSTEAIAEGLKILSEDDNLRKELIEKGYKQIEKFSWEETAKKTLKVYKSISQEV